MRLRLKGYILLTLLLCAATVKGQGGNRIEFSADSTLTEFIENGVIKRYVGNVAARSADLLLKADEAVYNSVQNVTRLFGRTMLQDSIRTLYSDSLIYYDKREEAIASGNVRGMERARSFRAGRIRYLRNSRLFFGSGGVTVREDSIRSSVTGMEMTFNDSTRNGLIIGMPSLVREDEKGSIITITSSDTVTVLHEQRIAEIGKNVVVKKDSMTATSERARYEDAVEKVTLFGNPVIEHIMHGKGDEDNIPLRIVSEVAGDTVFVFLKERKLVAVEVVGKATGVTVATDSIGAVYYRSILKSRNLRLDMTGDQVSKVVAIGSADSYYMHAATRTGRNQFVNTARGDTINFLFRNGSIADMQIRGGGSGESAGKYYEFETAKADSIKEQEKGQRKKSQ
jgi:lipopolysaccharide export system protein LptA